MIRHGCPRFALLAIAAIGMVVLCPPVTAMPASAADSDNLVWSVKPADNSVATGRPNFAYRADPGASLRDSLDVTNLGDSPLTLAVYAADAFTPQGGGIDLLPAGATSVDVGSWITLDSSTIQVAPQQSVTVPFTLTVPAGARPGDHAGGIVTAVTSGSGSFAVERRLGSRVLIRVSGELAPALAVSDVAVGYGAQFDPFASTAATVSYTVTNTGNVRLDAHPVVTVHGPFGALARTAITDDLGELLPGSSRHFQVAVPAVWALVHLSATVTLQPFPSNPNDLAASFDLPAVSAGDGIFAVNWGQLILLVVALALLVWWLLRSRVSLGRLRRGGGGDGDGDDPGDGASNEADINSPTGGDAR